MHIVHICFCSFFRLKGPYQRVIIINVKELTTYHFFEKFLNGFGPYIEMFNAFCINFYV